MNSQAIVAVTKAFDTALVNAARDQFSKLRVRLNGRGIAENIHKSLRSLERLQSGLMPDYDAWDALLYSLWYQPAQVNLAYTLAKHLILVEKDVFGEGSLQVYDFGCGALAMQFGLALAVADALQEGKIIPKVVVISDDASEPMVEIGWNIWNNFVNETTRYPELSSLLDAYHLIEFDDHGDSGASCWVTAIHVAYEENADKVKQELDHRVDVLDPDLVLVTTNRVSGNWTYSPLDYGYTNKSWRISGIVYQLGDNGGFRATTKFRSDLYDNHIAQFRSLLNSNDELFVRNYLKKLPTKWNAIDSSQTVHRLYLKA